MNKEEKEAIDTLKSFSPYASGGCNADDIDFEISLETLINSIENYEKNYISKDVIINKIKELENKKEKTRTEKGALWGNEIYITDLKIQALKELLESEE